MLYFMRKTLEISGLCADFSVFLFVQNLALLKGYILHIL